MVTDRVEFNSVCNHKSDCQSFVTLPTELVDTKSCCKLKFREKKMNQKNMIVQNMIIKIFDKSEMQRLKSAFKTRIKN